LLEGEIVRFKRATPQRGGITPAAIAEASRKMKRLGVNLYQGLNDQCPANLYEKS
jgi:hypothetical protein